MKASARYSNYYDFLEKEIRSFKGSFKEYILYLPALFRMLTSALDHPELEADDRLKVLTALGYFVAPNDILPESVYGPAGYIDDVFVCAIVLNILINKYGVDFVAPYWEHETDSLVDFVSYAIHEAKEDLGELAPKVLEYTGIGVKYSE